MTPPPGGRPTFRAAPLRARVPATSANLGPGFDAFGAALGLYDDVVAQVSDDAGVRVDVHGEGADSVPRDHRHLVAKTMLKAFDALGGRPRGLDLVCANRIPHSRGLGSSAAAIVSGLVLARALVVGGEERLPDSALLDLAASLEGHPDNVAACLQGGVTVAWTRDDGTTGVLRAVPSSEIVPVVCVPSTAVQTRRARGMLPVSVPHADAAHNAARAALLLTALTSRPDLLLDATDDRIHQGYRRAAYPRSLDLVAKLRAGGIPAAISGAGPTVLAMAGSGSAADVAGLAGGRFETSVLEFDVEGARLLPLDA
ncbi:MAG TPA: homoserine kinase [Candidatus Nanopelagicales bacterium]|nr:homoserine kinase [Candidatus Nanopelagicales bacterium]